LNNDFVFPATEHVLKFKGKQVLLVQLDVLKHKEFIAHPDLFQKVKLKHWLLTLLNFGLEIQKLWLFFGFAVRYRHH
jgi:hypothetical protein